jgi:hypothetical protein
MGGIQLFQLEKILNQAGIMAGGGKVEKALWQPLLMYTVLFVGCQGDIG